MYMKHPAFEILHDDSTKIWRYIDFTKFVSMLDKKSLFFCRSDKLPDTFEGSTSKANMELRQNMFKSWGDSCNEMVKRYSESCKENRKDVYINCWHINAYESAAMWKLYLKSNEGIAIQTTIKLLKDSFINTHETVFIGQIKYIDYDNDPIPENNGLYSFLHKRKSFEYEQELRAIYYYIKLVESENKGVYYREEVDETGFNIDVDLNILIDKIFVSPTAPKWFYELMKSVANKYNLNKEIMQSSLAEDPIY